MENYIVTIYAKEEHADEVGEYYKELQSKYESAPGFIGRKIFRAKNGAMAAAVKATYSEEELAASSEEDHDHGQHFVMIEEWESVQDRINFGRTLSKEHHMKVIPYLLPNHSHEFYKKL